MKKLLSLSIISVLLFSLVGCAKASDLVVISGITETVWLGDVLDLTGTYDGDDGRYLYEWSSSNEKVATIEAKTDGIEVLYSDAVFTALSRGKTDLTLKIFTGGKNKSPIYKKITVKVITEEDLPDAEWLDVESERVTLKIGEDKSIAAIACPEGSIFKSPVKYTSKNSDIVTVDFTGTVHAKAVGKTDITVAYKEEDLTVSVEVLDVPESVDVCVDGKKVEEKLTIKLNESLPLTYECTPKDTGLRYLMFTADNKIADAIDGTLTGLIPGDTTLTIVCTDYPALTKTVTITVFDPDEEDIQAPFIIDDDEEE